MNRSPRPRLDVLLVSRGLCSSRARAQDLIHARQVEVGGRVLDKPGTRVAPEAEIAIRGRDHPFVSRGGLKLQAALEQFRPAGLDVSGRVAMDVGAATGGFTDCLLQAGAHRVHAVDVGHGQLAPRLADDARVQRHERRDIRSLTVDALGERVELIVADCSFIGAAKVVPHLPRFLGPEGDVVVLVKPQFELEPGRVGKGGIVRGEAERRAALARVVEAAVAAGFVQRGQCASPVAGRAGNRELFLWLSISG